MSPYLSFRPNSPDDLALYASFFRNETWLFNSGFQRDDFKTDEQLRAFMECHHPAELKGVVFETKTGREVGIAHFKHVGENDLELTGGIRPDLLNSGMGLLATVVALDQAFKTRSFGVMRTIIYQQNTRSARIDQKMGFRKSGHIIRFDVRLFDEYILTREEFYGNEFNRHFLRRNGLLCEEI